LSNDINRDREISLRNEGKELLVISIISVLIILSSLYSFLLFHTIVELMSIIIAGGIFIIGWNSRKYINSSFFLVLGTAFLFIGTLDLIHTMAYKGMGIFPEYDADLSTQLWIAARYMQAFSFLLALLVIHKTVNPNYLIIGYIIITVILVVLIFQRIFPECFVEGSGLTPFKIISEYVINFILFICLIILKKSKDFFRKKVYFLLILSIISTIISELAFTFYIDVYGFSNFLGHVFKIFAFWFIYRAIIQIGFENPISLLFKDLNASYNEYDQIFNVSIPFRVIDKNWNIVKVNETYLKYFGMEKEEIMREKCYNLSDGHKCGTEDCSMTRIINGEMLNQSEIIGRLKNGTLRYYIVYSVPWKTLEGEFNGIIQNFIDITRRKKAELKLERFVSTVSHELRTPITVLITTIDFINKKGRDLPLEIMDKLRGNIYKNIRLLNELIDDILMISKLDEDKILIDLKLYHPFEILNNIFALMETLMNEKKISIVANIDKNITLYGDSKRIEQIFRIFLDNAIKYSKENSKIEITATENYQGEYNPTKSYGVLFQIRDYGLGISNEDLPNIFKRFYRSTQVINISGTGLGLSIAKELIEMHQGKVFIESKLGEGTRVSLFLPKIETKSSKKNKYF